MTGTKDRTGEVPMRRMAVVRGVLQSPESPLDDEARTHAAAAAAVAVKNAGLLLPFADSFHPTHIDTMLDPAPDGTGIVCTVTVQAFARAPLSPAAIVGVAAALAALAGDADEARISDIEVVQNVTA